MHMVIIYTDGSSRGNPGPGGWAAVISYKLKVKSVQKDWITEIGDREAHTTNNRMELTACIKALEFVSNLQLSTVNLQLFTDSEYVMKGITLWIKGWQAKGWKTAAKKPVLNQDLWQELLMVTEGKNISWKYVAGHSGELLNERCDEIATSFADGLNIDLYDGPRNSYGHF